LRKIDLFNHVLPPGYFERFMKVAPSFKDIGKRMRGIPMLWDLDVRLRVMDAFGTNGVLSLRTPIQVFAESGRP
jgi:aminocarboxymuconate-semialdehyde decarboxylase